MVAPVGFWPRSVTIRARAPAQRPLHVGGRGPSSSTPTGIGRSPRAGTRSRRLPQPGSSTATASPGRRWASERALHGVERSGGEADRPVGDAVGVERGAGQAAELVIDRGVAVQHGLPGVPGGGLGQCVAERGQQRGVRVAGGEVPCSGRHLEADLVVRGGGGARPHPAAAPARGLDDAAVAQQAVGGGDGVGVDAEFGGEFPQRWQRGARRKRALSDGAARRSAAISAAPRPVNVYSPITNTHYALVQKDCAISSPPSASDAYAATDRTVPTRIRRHASYDREIGARDPRRGLPLPPRLRP